jgi:hypothetical protein
MPDSFHWYWYTGEEPPRRGIVDALKRAGKASARLLVAGAKSVPILAAMVALATSSFSLYYVLDPERKPREKLGASITKLTIEHKVEYGQYVRRTTGREASDSGDFESPDQMGLLLNVQIEVRGFRQRSYVASLNLLDATSKSRVLPKMDGHRRRLDSTCPHFSPAASEDKVVTRCWLSYPGRNGKFIIRVSLWDAGTKELVDAAARDRAEIPESARLFLDVADTEPFQL